MDSTFYELLEVSPDADTDTIRQAYREKAKAYHPDRSDDPNATEIFQWLVEAEETLTDSTERERYDRLGHVTYCREVLNREVEVSEEAQAAQEQPVHEHASAEGRDHRAAARATRDGRTNRTRSYGSRGYSRAERERRAAEAVNEDLGGKSSQQNTASSATATSSSESTDASGQAANNTSSNDAASQQTFSRTSTRRDSSEDSADFTSSEYRVHSTGGPDLEAESVNRPRIPVGLRSLLKDLTPWVVYIGLIGLFGPHGRYGGWGDYGILYSVGGETLHTIGIILVYIPILGFLGYKLLIVYHRAS